jgi:hypothetical protein
MSLEEKIEALTAAVEKNTAALLGKVASKAAAEPKPAPKAEPKPAPKSAAKAKPKAEPENDGGLDDEDGPEAGDVTLEDVKVALRRYKAAESMESAIALLKKYGVDNVNKLDEGDWGPIVEEIDSLLD